MLPEWAGKNRIKNCHILYGGFNPQWAAGQLERQTVDKVAQSIVQSHPNATVAVIVTSWYEPMDVISYLSEINPEYIIECSLTDPYGSVSLLADRLDGRMLRFGYTTTGTKFDFWAVACSKFFKTYTEEELCPTNLNYLFLNYNRKPHVHRVQFVNKLEEAGLTQLGCVTMSGNPLYTVGDIDSDYLQYGASDVVGDIGIPNDIYSLGRMDIWNRSLINVVSETEYSVDGTFLSEKVYKPIIGMRPFIINGNPSIYTWLKDAGFDCFDDIFPVEEIIKCRNLAKQHDICIQSLMKYATTDIQLLYETLLPRLKQNRLHFFEYAKHQSNLQFNIIDQS